MASEWAPAQLPLDQLGVTAVQVHPKLYQDQARAAKKGGHNFFRLANLRGWMAEADRNKAEVRVAQHLEAEAHAASCANEDTIRDLQEQLLKSEAEIQSVRVEARSAMESSRACAHLEALVARGQRHERDAAELRVTVGVLRERLSRQEQAMARLRRESSLGVSEDSGAHGALARPPVPAPFAQGRQGGALRGLAKGIGSGYASKAAPLTPLSEDGPVVPPYTPSEESSMHPVLSASRNSLWSEASSMPDAFSAARRVEEGNQEVLGSSTGSLLTSVDGFAMVRDTGLQRDYSASELTEVSVLDAFAVVRGLSSAEEEQ